MSLILFLKSHIPGYTRKDGTYVAPHDNKVVKKPEEVKGAQFGGTTAGSKPKWHNSLLGGSKGIPTLFTRPAEPKHYPNAVEHPQADDDGKVVRIHEPDHATPAETWTDAAAIATFTPGSEVPAELNGVPFEPWHDAPTDEVGWHYVDGQNFDIDEPDFEHGDKKPAAGVIIQEPDGRIWLLRPTNGFGGYDATFPKGRIEHGMSMQASAIKEAFEETGLKVEITGYLGDVERTMTKARYYMARRVGGTPKAMGWEAQAVQLVPKDQLHAVLNAPIDRHVAKMAGVEHPKGGESDEEEMHDL